MFAERDAALLEEREHTVGVPARIPEFDGVAPPARQRQKENLEPLEIQPVGGYFRLLARRLLNGLQFFSGGFRWIWFAPAALLLVPPALIMNDDLGDEEETGCLMSWSHRTSSRAR